MGKHAKQKFDASVKARRKEIKTVATDLTYTFSLTQLANQIFIFAKA